MPIRVTDSSMSMILSNRINANRSRLETAQEQVSTGKRINRPSDDPFGAEAVLRLRTSQATVEQFQRSADEVKDGLSVADTALESHAQLLDRAKTLMVQAASDSTSVSGKLAIAGEIEALRSQMLNLANQSYQGVLVFGGTRQSVAPFDSTGAPAVALTSTQMVQIEPGAAPIAAGVTADTIFSNVNGSVFDALAGAAAALRGTGNPAADRTTVLTAIDSMTQFSDQNSNARSTLGASMEAVDNAHTRMGNESLSYQEAASRYESVDMAGAAVELTQASNAVQAALQSIAYRNKGSLMDLIG